MSKICKKRVHGNGRTTLSWAFKKCPRLLCFPLLAFCLKSVINLLPWKFGGITGIFLLFKNVFNMDQYVLGLVLRSNNIYASFE